MFNFFKKASQTPADSEDSPVKVIEGPKLDPISIDFDIELGGGKGWTENVSCVLYHQHLGFLCAGTLSGSLYVYGIGFQFLRKRFQDTDTAVKTMHAIYPDRVLVAYDDNSMACFDLPKLNMVCFLLPSQWLPSSAGDIVTVHVDEPGLRSYIYLSISDGTMYVMDITANIFRVCDYNVPVAKVSLPKSILKSIQMSPKDEKYIGLGYENEESGLGAIVIYDMVKQKVYRTYATNAITSLAWTHVGDILYAGSSSGDVYCAQLDKQSCTSVFNSNSAKSSGGDDDVPSSIKQLSWLSPQGNMMSGCLFILLDLASAEGYNDGDMKECIIGLSALGKNYDMTQVFSLPSQASVSIQSFAFVPIAPLDMQAKPPVSVTKPRSNSFAPGPVASSPNSPPAPSTDENDLSTSLPGLLLITQRTGKSLANQQLMIMSLPTSAVGNWALDIGTLPAPRRVWLTTCGSGNVTTVNASKPTTSTHSFVGVLIGYKSSIGGDMGGSSLYMKSKLDVSDYVASHRMDEGEGDDDADVDEGVINDDHDITHDLSVPYGELEEYISTARPCDVVFVGQDDGYVVCWGVSRPSDISVPGRNNIWSPLLAIKSSHNSISNIAYQDSAGILIIADAAGKVLIWEVYETGSGIGYIQYQKSILKPPKKQAGSVAGDERTLSVDDQHLDDGTSSQASYDANVDDTMLDKILSFKPNNIRHASTFDIQFASITQIKIIAEYLIVVIGTVTGAVYTIALYDRNPTPVAVNLSSFSIREAVSGISFSYYYRHDIAELIPAVYVSFESNAIIVFHPITHEIVAYCGGPSDTKPTLVRTVTEEDEDEGHDGQSDNSDDYISKALLTAAFACVLDNSDNVFNPPEVMNPVEIIAANQRPAPEEREKAILRKSVLTLFTRSAEPPTTANPVIEGRKSSIAPPMDSSIPTIFPHTLILLSGRRLLTYNISKFNIPKKSGPNTISPPSAHVVSSKIISTADIISGNVVSYIEEASRAWSDPLPCLLVANCEGGVFALRLKDKSSVGYINLFEGVLPSPIKFSTGIVLQNGVCYFNHHNKTIYSARASSTTHILSQPLPTRAIISSHFSTNAQLSNGRESKVAAAMGAVKKKRQSTLGLMTATDLDKLFSKTRDQRMRDDLFDRERKMSVISDNSDSDGNNPVQNVKNDVRSTANVMIETRMVLEERGEKLEQLAKQSDDLKSGAADFHQNAKAQKDIMKQKNSRWGLF